jgi:hypothetical protein
MMKKQEIETTLERLRLQMRDEYGMKEVIGSKSGCGGSPNGLNHLVLIWESAFEKNRLTSNTKDLFR